MGKQAQNVKSGAIEATAVSTDEQVVPVPEPVNLVVCAFPGTEELMDEVWHQNCDTPFAVKTIEDMDIRTILESCIADGGIADNFVLIPANTIPCSMVSFPELMMPVVYIDNRNEEHYNHSLPMFFEKEKLVEYLGANDTTGELFIKTYVERFRNRPIRVGYQFGNYVTPVLRPNPCENKVLEAFVKRKFVTANPLGFAAIEHIIRSTLLK